MTLRQTTFAIAAITAITFVACFYIASDFLLSRSVAQFEEDSVRLQIENTVHAIRRETEDLDTILSQWTSAPGAVDQPPAWSRNTSAVLIVFDQEGNVAARHSLGFQTQSPSELDALSQHLANVHITGRTTRGFLQHPVTPLAIASRHLSSTSQTILIATSLDEMLRQTAVDGLSLLTTGSPGWASLTGSGSPFQLRVLNDENIEGHRAIRDINGDVAAVLKLTLPRGYHNETTQIRNTLLVLFTLWVTACGILLVISMRRQVLDPIEELSQRLGRIANNGGSSDRIDVEGSEELLRLTQNMKAALKRARETDGELIRTERMRVAGELSAGVNHNLNNILTGILGPAEYLEKNLRDSDLLPDARRIHRAALKARDLVSRFSQAVRVGTPLRLRAVDVNQAVRQAIETVRPVWQDEAQSQGLQIEIETDLTADVPVQGTPDELNDVLVNLLMNAVDAISEDGTIRITTSVQDTKVVLTVEDEGLGMERATRERVFEPFFTTKAEVGAGLGLSTV